MNLKKELDDKKVIETLNKIKDVFIFVLLLFFILIPILKQIDLNKIVIYEYKIVWVIGCIGFYFLLFYQIINYRQSKNKKEYLKQMLPIILLAIYMLWTLISCIFADNKYYAIFGNNWRHDGYISYIAYAGFFALAFYIKSDKLKRILLNIFLIVSLITNITVLLEEKFKLGVFWANNSKRAVFYNLNHYGYYLLLSAIVSNALFISAKKKKVKIVYSLLYIYFVYQLICNNTFGCYLALFVTLIIFLIFAIKKKEKRELAVLSIIIYIVVSIIARTNVVNNLTSLFADISKISTIFSDEPDEGWKQAGTKRMELWVDGLSFFAERPIIGYGPENLGQKYKNLSIRFDRPHNLIIQQLTTSGLVGAVLYITAITLIAVRSFKRLSMDNTIHLCAHFACSAYLISAMFGNSMFYTSPYFFIFLGFSFYETIKETKDGKIKIG